MSAGDSSKTGPGVSFGPQYYPQPTDSGTVLTPAGVEVGDGTNTRVSVGAIAFDSNGNPTDYGIRVVSSDGTTVIIDGTSDVFKISASGSQSMTAPTNTGAVLGTVSKETTVTALGTLSATPGFQAWIADTTNTTSQARTIGFDLLVGGGGSGFFAAGASGGATTDLFIPLQTFAEYYTYLSSSQAVVHFGAYNEGPSVALYGFWYTLIEAAM